MNPRLTDASYRPLGRRSLLAAALLPVAAACDAGESDDGGTGSTSTGESDGGGDAGVDAGQDPSDAGGSPGIDASSEVARLSTGFGRAEIAVVVRPLVRVGDHLVLTLDLEADDPHSDLGDDPGSTLDIFWSPGWGSDGRRLMGLRLLDLVGDRVLPPAYDAEDRTVRGWTPAAGVETGQPTWSTQVMYADPGEDELSLFVPRAGLVDAIPVIDGEIPSVGRSEPFDPATVADARIEPMIGYSVDLQASIRERGEEELTTVSIAADVLFDSSSADLSEQSLQSLQEAAARITSHQPGEVTVIGHTDDVGDDASNQDLSERRAEAVATELATLLDSTDYPLRTEGRGETEPVADNASVEGRALNRRVDLTIATPLAEDQPPADEALAFDGNTSTGDEGVVITDAVRECLLRAPSARLTQDHLVLTLELTLRDEEVDSVFGVGGLHAMLNAPLEFFLEGSAGGLGVVNGSALTYPALHLHRTGSSRSSVRPLTDLHLNGRADGGIPFRTELVYPRGILGLETGGSLMVQYGRTDFRLTDIPID